MEKGLPACFCTDWGKVLRYTGATLGDGSEDSAEARRRQSRRNLRSWVLQHTDRPALHKLFDGSLY